MVEFVALIFKVPTKYSEKHPLLHLQINQTWVQFLLPKLSKIHDNVSILSNPNPWKIVHKSLHSTQSLKNHIDILQWYRLLTNQQNHCAPYLVETFSIFQIWNFIHLVPNESILFKFLVGSLNLYRSHHKGSLVPIYGTIWQLHGYNLNI